MKMYLEKSIYYLFLLVLILLPNTIYASDKKIEITTNDISKYYSNINDAILDTVDNEETVLKLLVDIEVGSKITIPSNKNIIIDGNNQHSITYLKKDNNTWYTGQLFEIKSNSNVIFRNLTIDGQNNWTFDNESYMKDLEQRLPYTDFTKYIKTEVGKPSIKAHLFTNAGNLRFEKVTIKNCFSTRGLVYASLGTTTFKDTNIVHNTTHDGGLAIYQVGANTTAYIEGTTLIEDNYVIGNGGIFRINGGSKLEMNGGIINNNKSINSNGVVAMIYQTGSKFILNAGLITNNSGVSGKNNGRNGMVYVHNGSTFIMNGGTIAGNYGQITGGVDVPGYTGSHVELNQGTIANNKGSQAGDHHTDAYFGGDYNLTFGENMLIEGDIYVAGDIVNNGTIRGDVTLALGAKVQNTISGSGIIEGDVVLNYSGEIPPIIDKNVNITGKIETADTTKYTTARLFYNGGIDENNNSQQKIVIELNSKLTFPVITREGHTFIGWYINKDLTNEWQHTVITQDTSIYAKWKINSYELTLKIDNQEIKETLVYGDKIILPEDPIKEGYIFKGWENYQEDMTMPGEDITLIAIFEEIKEPIINDEENPNTSDIVSKNIIISIISFWGLLITYFILKKKKLID